MSILFHQQPYYDHRIKATRRYTNATLAIAHGAELQSPVLARCKSRKLMLLHSLISTALPLLTHAGRTPLPQIGLFRLLLAHTLVHDLSVVVRSLLAGLGSTTLECDPVPLVLQTLRSD